MTEVRVKATASDARAEEEGSADFVAPKNGFYHITCVAAEAGYAKNEDGSQDRDRPRIEVTWQITAEGVEGEREPQGNYGNIWDYVTFGESAGRTRARYIKAFYPDKYDPDSDMDVKFNTEHMVERTMLAKLSTKREKDRNGEYRDRTQIRQLVPVGSLSPDEVGEGDEVDSPFGGAEPMSDIAGDDDPFGGGLVDDEPEPESDNLLSEDELDAMDAAQVAAIAKEFDLDTKDYVVAYKSGKNKGKTNVNATKTAVIAAILEAQGSNEPDDGDGVDDDSPF